MAIATAITGKIMKAKVSYGPTKLAMCLMLFLGFKGSVIAVGVAVVAGVIFVLAARSKKRKISLAPAIFGYRRIRFLRSDHVPLYGRQGPHDC